MTAAATVVLLSGRGSNMRAIAEQARRASIPIDIRAVISDRAEAGGLTIARELGIHATALPAKQYPDRTAFDAALAAEVESYAPAWVLLAGYMRILNGAFVRQFLGRLVNIHPSLLPKYPGLNTHRRALEARDSQHGATVHFVTEELDAGPNILQGRVPVLPGDTEATLSARVQRIEHMIYPRAVEWLAGGQVEMRGGKVYMNGRQLVEAPIVEFTEGSNSPKDRID